MKKHESDPPACVECVHFRVGDSGNQCYSDDCSVFDPVDGRQPIQASAARGMYAQTGGGKCGPSGAFFKAKPPPPWIERHAGALILGAAAGTGAAIYFSKVVWILLS